MLEIKYIDKILRAFTSVVYRLMIVFLAASVYVIYGNIFPLYLYVLITLLYLLAIAFLFLRKHKYSFVRMLVDLSFIAFVLYGKELDNILTITLLLLPIVNSPNHSGEKRDSSLYVLTTIVYVTITNFNEFLSPGLAILALGVIGYFENLRSSIYKLTSNLMEVIDESYVANLKIGKLHRIYGSVIENIKNSRYGETIPIIGIHCFIIRKEKIVIVNTSSYVYKIDIDIESISKQLEDEELLRDVELSIDGVVFKSNALIKIQHTSKRYLFLVTFEEQCNSVVFQAFLNYALKLLLARIAQILEVEWEIKQSKKSYYERYNTNIEYFESAVETMHFLNNKFSPITTYLDLVGRIDALPDSEAKHQLISVAENTRKTALRSAKTIIQRAEQLLEINTDVAFKTLELCTVWKLFTLVRSSWNDHFYSEEFKTGWGESDLADEIYINTDGLFYVLSNIMHNMQKHGSGQYRAEFEVKENTYVVRFKNKFTTNPDELNAIVGEFMSDDIQEIEMRKHEGLGLIKKYLKQMSIGYNLYVNEDEFNFELHFGANEI